MTAWNRQSLNVEGERLDTLARVGIWLGVSLPAKSGELSLVSQIKLHLHR